MEILKVQPVLIPQSTSLADGRISTGDIAPGESTTITFDGLGIYKLYDPDYNYMRIEAASFPIVDNFTTGTTNNQQGN